jgi:nucleotide-binding universal stress UspA family protein
MIKVVMGVIMVIVLFSRALMIPVYMSQLGLIGQLGDITVKTLKSTSFAIMIFALALGAFIILKAIWQGRRAEEVGWKRILLATDGSKYSKSASERAIDFAFQYSGQIIAVSVVDVPAEFYGEAPGAIEDLIKKAKGYVEDVKIRAESVGIKVETFVREGETYKTILDLAKDLNADTIVMGSHGRTGIRRLLMGSVTEKVIGYSTCPVLVVKSY